MKLLLPFLLAATVVAGELTFEEALRKAEEFSPVLQVAQEIQKSVDETKEFHLKGAAPELEIGTENFGIGEVEVVVTKELRPTAKRAPIEIELALRKERAAAENRAALLELHKKVAESYIELAFLHESQDRLTSILHSLEEEKQEISRRVRLGAASELELLEHEGLLIGIEEQLGILKSDLLHAEATLNTLWDEDRTGQVHSMEELATRLYEQVDTLISPLHPLYTPFAINKSEAALLKAQSEGSRKPDFALSGGYKRVNESKENSFLLGFSVGFANKSSSAILDAEASLLERTTAIEKDAIERELKKGLSLFTVEKERTKRLLTSLKEKRIPLVQSLIDAAEKRYRRGALPIYEKIRYRRELYHLQLEELVLEKELLLTTVSHIIYTGNLLSRESN